MITTIAIFYASLAAIVLMVSMKRRELAKGKRYFLTRVAEDNDHIFERLGIWVRTGVSYFNKHTFIAFLQWTAAGILSWMRDLYVKLFHIAHRHPHTKKVIDMVQGKGEPSNGGASFFLKKISDEPSFGSTTPTE